MADIVVDGATKVSFVPTIASATLVPTIAELTAGTSLEQRLIMAGLEGFDAATAEVDNTSLASTFDTKLPGRTSYSGTGLVMKQQSGTDSVQTTLATKNTAGYIVIRDGIPSSTAWAVTQKVSVYPILTGTIVVGIGRNEANAVLRYRIPTTISAEPNQQAVITA